MGLDEDKGLKTDTVTGLPIVPKASLKRVLEDDEKKTAPEPFKVAKTVEEMF